MTFSTFYNYRFWTSLGSFGKGIVMTASKPAVAIRKATPSDVPTIYNFIRELAIYEKAEECHVGSKQELLDTLFCENPYAHVIIASVDGSDVGFALYFFNYSTWRSRVCLLDSLLTFECMANEMSWTLVPPIKMYE